jgi:hypothetical protein
MGKVTEEMAAKFRRLNRQGQSYRAIGKQFGKDWRTVKAWVQKAVDAQERDHQQVLAQQVDARYLEEHYQLLLRVALGLGSGVRTDPMYASMGQSPELLIEAMVQLGLGQAADLLTSRGLDLDPPPMASLGDQVGEFPGPRLARKLLGSLLEHEPELKASVDLWKGSWTQFQQERSKLVSQARNLLLRHWKVEEAVAQALASELCQDVIEARLLGRKPGTLLIEPRAQEKTALVLDQGLNRREVYLGRKPEVERLAEVYRRSFEQASHPERVRPIQGAYEGLMESVERVQDLVDCLVLMGKPAGYCSLCPTLTPSTPGGRI